MYNVPADATMLQLQMARWCFMETQHRWVKDAMLPRLLWVRKSMTLKELHYSVFQHMRFVFSEWADWTHPESERNAKRENNGLKNLIAFPYRRSADDPQMTKAVFDGLSDEEAFELCCPGIVEGKCDGNIQSN